MILLLYRVNNYLGWLWLVLVLLAFTAVNAQQNTKVQSTEFDAQRLEKLRKQADYQYEEVNYSPSTWQQIKQSIRDWLQSLMDTPQKQTIWSWILTLFAALVLIFVALRLSGADKYLWLRKANAPKENIGFFEQFEQLNATDLDQKIQEAISTQAYHLAVRWFYLKSLKVLQAQHLIQWQKDKTNQTYLAELGQQQPHLATSFQQLTLWFEYVYYGDFEIEYADFEEIKRNFEIFYQEVSKL